MLTDFLVKLVDKATCWCPRFKIINPEEMAVRVTCGRFKKSLEPGLYWYWPLITCISHVIVTKQRTLFDTQMMTRDGESVEIICDAVYTVGDPRKALLTVQDYDEILGSYGEQYLGEFVCMHDLSEIIGAVDESGGHIGALEALKSYVYGRLEITADGCGLYLLDINVRAFCKVWRVKTGE